MIRIKTNAEVELIRESALLVSDTLAELASIVKAGVTTEFLDKRAEEFILDNGAVPSFLHLLPTRQRPCPLSHQPVELEITHEHPS